MTPDFTDRIGASSPKPLLEARTAAPKLAVG